MGCKTELSEAAATSQVIAKMADSHACLFVAAPARFRSRARSLVTEQHKPNLPPPNGVCARAVTKSVSAPTIEKKTVRIKQTQKERKSDKGKMYNVFIINDPFNKREYVVQQLLKIIPGMSFSRAYAVMDMAHNTGKGLVITTVLEMAEAYCGSILSAGIFSTVEPES